MRCLVSSLSSPHRGVWPTCLGLGQTGPGLVDTFARGKERYETMVFCSFSSDVIV